MGCALQTTKILRLGRKRIYEVAVVESTPYL